MSEGKRPDERGVHQAECRAVGTDAKRKDEHRHEGEDGRFAQRARGIRDILPESGHARWTARWGPWLVVKLVMADG